MYFDLEDRCFDTPTIESAMSWRERSLLALFAHLLVVALVLGVPQLPIIQDAAARREERLAEMVEEQRIAQLQERQDAPEFIFVAPLVDTPAPAPPLQADLSDLDRVAQSPSQAENPLNDLPNADGNSFQFVEAEDPSDGLDPVTESAEDLPAAELALTDPVDGVDDGTADAPQAEEPEATPGDGGALANPFPAARRDASRERPTLESGTILNQALRGLQGVARNQTFHNLVGRTDRYGSQIQFDSKGVDFGSWIRRFRAQNRTQLAAPVCHLVDVWPRRPDVQRASGRGADRLDGDRAVRHRRVHELRAQRAPRLESDLPPARGVSGRLGVLHGDLLFQRAAARPVARRACSRCRCRHHASRWGCCCC